MEGGTGDHAIHAGEMHRIMAENEGHATVDQVVSQGVALLITAAHSLSLVQQQVRNRAHPCSGDSDHVVVSHQRRRSRRFRKKAIIPIKTAIVKIVGR